jgi:hypothetical protein
VPYQVIFFSSGGREEGWSVADMRWPRVNTLIGFPLGGVLSLAIKAAMISTFRPPCSRPASGRKTVVTSRSGVRVGRAG